MSCFPCFPSPNMRWELRIAVPSVDMDCILMRCAFRNVFKCELLSQNCREAKVSLVTI